MSTYTSIVIESPASVIDPPKAIVKCPICERSDFFTYNVSVLVAPVNADALDLICVVFSYVPPDPNQSNSSDFISSRAVAKSLQSGFPSPFQSTGHDPNQLYRLPHCV